MADLDRPRSFIERYVIARAASFTPGKSRDEAGAAVLEARAVYRQIALVAKTTEPATDIERAVGVAQAQAHAQAPGQGRYLGRADPIQAGVTAHEIQETYRKFRRAIEQAQTPNHEIALRQALDNKLQEIMEKGAVNDATPKAYNPSKAF